MFDTAFIESLAVLLAGFGNATESQKKVIRKTVRAASTLLGMTLPSVEVIYKDRLEKGQ